MKTINAATSLTPWWRTRRCRELAHFAQRFAAERQQRTSELLVETDIAPVVEISRARRAAQSST
jgi:hypothetical protein